ncbi:hypothetical protein PybrP1_008503 [[Pythium] brassicae (nom. inval.)]|nr:hypothetical protein PybrP1_008503 [[Pythium] brassicae (nom. inval.)]
MGDIDLRLLRARELCLLGDYDAGLPEFRRALQDVRHLSAARSATPGLQQLLLELEGEYAVVAEYHRRLGDLAVAASDLQLTRQRRKLQEESRRQQRNAQLQSDDNDSEMSDRRWQKPRAASTGRVMTRYTAVPATRQSAGTSSAAPAREKKLPVWANKRESQSTDAAAQAMSRFSSRSLATRKPALPAAARGSSLSKGKENAHRNNIKRTSIAASKASEPPSLSRRAGARPNAKRRESAESSGSASVSEPAAAVSSTIAGKAKYSELARDSGWVDQELIEAIERDIVDQGERVTFEDIAGLEHTKQLLQETVMLPQIAPHLFEAVAHECGATFFNVSASTLSSKYRGDSEKMVRILFDMARYYEPSIIFMDEIDAIASARGAATEHEASRRVKTELLVQINGVASSEHDGARVMLLAATNLPWELDEAMRRRLTKRVYIPLPEAAARRTLFELNLRRVELAPDVAVADLVRETQGYSGDDITSVCETAKRMPVKRVYTPGLLMELSRQDQDAGDELRDRLERKRLIVTKSDFAEALRNVSNAL